MSILKFECKFLLVKQDKRRKRGFPTKLKAASVSFNPQNSIILVFLLMIIQKKN